ncbi:MAG: assimilatory sulfite reductase (NADPH) flavoprotein subunit [Opitutales bacterium]|nr:assimilatory sulfite reductase (NADPH) flavoprotein subunit [Opitutales bacterium]
MSNPTFQLPDNAPFRHEQKVALGALVPTLSAQQASWLSGYFAAVAQASGDVVTAAAPAPAAPAAPKPTVPLTVLYGSESGNSEACAQEVLKEAVAAGFKAEAIDMGDYNREKLAKEKHLLVVVSTWGEGDPPENATDFYEFVMGDAAPKLDGLKFSVCALGDTSYADFCECGKQFDKRFEELGGTRILDRVDCDVDYETPFKEWLKAAMPKMVELSGVKEAKAEADAAAVAAMPAVSVVSEGLATVPTVEPYGKKNPFQSELKNRILLNGRGSAKETYHLEFSLEGSGLSYKPGDVLGMFPTNCEDVVEAVARSAGFRGDEIREDESGEVRSILEILETDYDITTLNANLLKKYQPTAKSKALDDLLKPDHKDKLSAYLHGRELRDMFADFPPADVLSMDQFLGLLRKMPPRLYSIASSIKAHPDEVHLTVGVVRYETHGISRKGVCSSYMAERLAVGDAAPIYLHHNKNFFLPEDPNTRTIMVGPGTGIAPFRAFIEERAEIGAKGDNWLFFGDQHFNSDFLYQLEWQDYMKKGILSRMDVAFSRDTDEKVYVQHRMTEQAKDLYTWLEEGAYFYVCGDASRMAKDVHEALIGVYQTQGGLSREAAEDKVKQLQKDKRYQRDVY